jgi:SAM-dependent methyltransferase
MSIDFHLDASHDDFIFRCQQLATPRILALMQAEVDFLRAVPETAESVLDIGCGSGRVLEALAGRARMLAGIDLVYANLLYSRRRVPRQEMLLLQGDALSMPFPDAAFAVSTVMINTLGNFGDAKVPLLHEMRRVGRVVVAGCYSTEAAEAQREWYAVMHAHGFLGTIDEAHSTPYLCVTSDGYRSERFDAARLTALFTDAGMRAEVTQPIPELLLATGVY